MSQVCTGQDGVGPEQGRQHSSPGPQEDEQQRGGLALWHLSL